MLLYIQEEIHHRQKILHQMVKSALLTVFVEKNKTVEEKQLPTIMGEEITLHEKKATLPTVYFKT